MRLSMTKAQMGDGPAGWPMGPEANKEWQGMSKRTLSWVSLTQAVIQVSGLLVILHACLH